MVGLTRASGDVPESGSNALLCVAAGGDHAAIWIDSSSSAVIADDRRGTKSLRFDDCSLPKKCEIAVMGRHMSSDRESGGGGSTVCVGYNQGDVSNGK